MLNEEEFCTWLTSQNLPGAGETYLRTVRSSPPQRAVGGGVAINVPSYYPSRKMGCTIQSESHTTERLWMLELEFDPDVYEYWDQPTSVPIEGRRSDGRLSRRLYTTDYLSIGKRGPVAYEVKRRTKINDLIARRPAEWILLEDGPRFVPAHAAYARLGIRHEVICADDLSQIRAENLQLLLHVRDQPSIEIPRAWIRRIERTFALENVVVLSNLLRILGTDDASPILQLIERGRLFTRLDRFRLSLADSAWIAAEPEYVDVLDAALIRIGRPISSSVSLAEVATTQEILRVDLRLRAISNPAASGKSRTTVWRYRRSLKHAGGNPMALQSDYSKCGPRGSQLGEAHDALIHQVLEEHYASADQPSLGAAYAIYLALFESRRQDGAAAIAGNPVIKSTFASRLAGFDAAKLALARGGRRASLAAMPPTNPVLRALAPARAFQFAHLDHWLVDLYVVIMRHAAWTFVLRPWVSFLIDSACDALLAFTLTLGSPSSSSCARVLRDCVRRHGRLPECIMTDSGADFRSTFYRSALAEMCIHKFERPTSAGRWGREVERTFGIFEKEVLGGLPGHIKASKRDRSVSRKFRSDQRAVLEPFDLHKIFEDFSSGWFNAHARGSHTVAPAVMLRESLSLYSCSGLDVDFDDRFRVATSVPAPASKYKVDPQRGVRTQDRHYTSLALQRASRRSVRDIRWDPEDDSLIYVSLGDQWNVCYSGASRGRVAADERITMYESLKLREGKVALREARRSGKTALGQLHLDAQARLQEKLQRVTDTRLNPRPKVTKPSKPRLGDIVPCAIVAGD